MLSLDCASHHQRPKVACGTIRRGLEAATEATHRSVAMSHVYLNLSAHWQKCILKYLTIALDVLSGMLLPTGLPLSSLLPASWAPSHESNVVSRAEFPELARSPHRVLLGPPLVYNFSESPFPCSQDGPNWSDQSGGRDVSNTQGMKQPIG